MHPTQLLQCLNALHQTSFTLLDKYPDGEQGAFALRDHLDERWVLKWASGARNLSWAQDAKTVTDLLRGLGYAAPRYLLIGTLPEGIYSIQSALPGAPIPRLSSALLPRLLALNELQAGQALPGRTDWHQEAISTVMHGGEGYCLHDSLQHHSQETAALLKTLQALVTAHHDAPHCTCDLVHGDFQQANILVQDEQISGIIDWDGFGAGDRVFDIATLLFYSYEQVDLRAQLWQYALERASLQLVNLYLAHLILRQVDWSLRYHDHTISERYIHRGHLLLQELAYRARDTR